MTRSQAQRWLIYALGGGLGHLTRALALGRAALQRGVRTTVVTNSPFADAVAPFVASEGTRGMALERLAPELDRTAVARRVRELLGRPGYDTLVVDTFPRGLGGELASELEHLAWRKVLVHRDLAPSYVRAKELVSFVEREFDLVMLPGERGPLASCGRTFFTEPWLIRDCGELWSRGRVRARLAARPDQPVVAVVAAGRAPELAEMAEIAIALRTELHDRAAVRPFALMGSGLSSSPLGVVAHWPLLELLAGVDVLVGAGGYNTVSEARAVGRPLVALVRRRLYDRQQRRLRADELVHDHAELRRRVDSLVAGWRPTAPLRYVNGAHRAVDAILRLR